MTQNMRNLLNIEKQEVTAEEFSSLISRFAITESTRIAVAVSGGPDSMALAFCVKRWSENRNLVAFIVDHQLRPESSIEAETTKQRLAAFGIRAEILRWDHDVVKSKIHATARKARYDLLIDACKLNGISDLLLAHHRDDQAETILMRFAKGSGLDGLAGIAPTHNINNIRLLRPFLAVPKERLIATCEDASLEFATDPSNSAQKYARGRLRNVQQLLSNEGFTVDRLVDLGERAREAKDALDYYTTALLRVAASVDTAGVIKLDLEHLRSAPKAVAVRALSKCLQTVHAEYYPPERKILLPLIEALCDDALMSAHTLHGSIINKTQRQAKITRELASITEVTPITAGKTILWDGRWKVMLSPECAMQNLVIKALGIQTYETIDKLSPNLRHKVPQGRARAAMPAFWQDSNLVLIPTLSKAENTVCFCSVMPVAW